MVYYLSAQLAMDRFLGKSCSKSDVIQALTSAPAIGIDLETTGLDFIADRILLCALSTEEDQFVIDATSVDIRFLKDILENPSIVKIGHNIGFDYKFLRGYDITLENVYDTMLVEQVLTAGRDKKYGLDRLVFDYLGITLNKSVRSAFHDGHSGTFTLQEITYASQDVQYLHDLSNMQVIKLAEDNLKRVADLENHAVLAVADIEYNGLYINQDKWRKQIKQAEIEKQTLSLKLDEMIMRYDQFKTFRLHAYNLNLFEPESSIRKVSVNWDSPSQVLQIMQTLVPTLESVGRDVISKHANAHELIPMYIKYKEWGKLVSSYGETFLENLYKDGKIHTSFHQILRTGRMSSSGPNMQQIPADNAYRNCFESGHPDWVFVSGDYSSQELALIAHNSSDPVWLQALQEGKDLHSICAELIFADEWFAAAEDDCAFYATAGEERSLGDTVMTVQAPAKQKCSCPKHKKLRDQVKTLNFGLAYGMSAHKLADRLDIEFGEAEELMKQYFYTFPMIKASLERTANFGKKYGYVMTLNPWFRRRYFPSWRGRMTDPKDMGAIERESKNSPIQGSGADMIKYALHLCRKEIRVQNLPIKLVMTVHDQIDTICHKDYATTWRDRMKELMEQSALLTIPSGLLKAEVNISNFWEK